MTQWSAAIAFDYRLLDCTGTANSAVFCDCVIFGTLADVQHCLHGGMSSPPVVDERNIVARCVHLPSILGERGQLTSAVATVVVAQYTVNYSMRAMSLVSALASLARPLRVWETSKGDEHAPVQQHCKGCAWVCSTWFTAIFHQHVSAQWHDAPADARVHAN